VPPPLLHKTRGATHATAAAAAAAAAMRPLFPIGNVARRLQPPLARQAPGAPLRALIGHPGTDPEPHPAKVSASPAAATCPAGPCCTSLEAGWRPRLGTRRLGTPVGCRGCRGRGGGGRGAAQTGALGGGGWRCCTPLQSATCPGTGAATVPAVRPVTAPPPLAPRLHTSPRCAWPSHPPPHRAQHRPWPVCPHLSTGTMSSQPLSHSSKLWSSWLLRLLRIRSRSRRSARMAGTAVGGTRASRGSRCVVRHAPWHDGRPAGRCARSMIVRVPLLLTDARAGQRDGPRGRVIAFIGLRGRNRPWFVVLRRHSPEWVCAPLLCMPLLHARPFSDGQQAGVIPLQLDRAPRAMACN
jgi:hypothetical protein